MRGSTGYSGIQAVRQQVSELAAANGWLAGGGKGSEVQVATRCVAAARSGLPETDSNKEYYTHSTALYARRSDGACRRVAEDCLEDVMIRLGVVGAKEGAVSVGKEGSRGRGEQEDGSERSGGASRSVKR